MYVYTMNTTQNATAAPATFAVIATEGATVLTVGTFPEAHIAGRTARDLQDALPYTTAVRYSYCALSDLKV